jgi:hypothetical protein
MPVRQSGKPGMVVSLTANEGRDHSPHYSVVLVDDFQ